MRIKTLVLSYLLAHSVKLLLLSRENYSFPDGVRFIFYKVLPPALFCGLYYQSEIKAILKLQSIRELARICKYLMLLSVFITSIYFLATQGIFITLSWSWFAFATYGFGFLAFYFILKKNGHSSYESLILAFLFCKLGGFLYEIPIYPFMRLDVGILFHRTHAFYLDFNYFLIPLLFYYFKDRVDFRRLLLKPVFLVSMGGYLAFSIFYYLNPYLSLAPFYIHRLPALFLIGSYLILLKNRIL